MNREDSSPSFSNAFEEVSTEMLVSAEADIEHTYLY